MKYVKRDTPNDISNDTGNDDFRYDTPVTDKQIKPPLEAYIQNGNEEEKVEAEPLDRESYGEILDSHSLEEEQSLRSN